MGACLSKDNFYAQVDIFNDEERKMIDISKIPIYQLQFSKFAVNYRNYFLQKERKNRYYVKSLLKNHQVERSNISVLIVLASNNEVYDINEDNLTNAKFFKISGDVATALLILCVQ